MFLFFFRFFLVSLHVTKYQLSYLILTLFHREWYSYHFPELVKIVNDNYMFAKLTTLIGDRTKLSEEQEPAVEELVMDSAKTRAIFEAAKSSMGV